MSIMPHIYLALREVVEWRVPGDKAIGIAGERAIKVVEDARQTP